jgi:hypothetical protein
VGLAARAAIAAGQLRRGELLQRSERRHLAVCRSGRSDRCDVNGSSPSPPEDYVRAFTHQYLRMPMDLTTTRHHQRPPSVCTAACERHRPALRSVSNTSSNFASGWWPSGRSTPFGGFLPNVTSTLAAVAAGLRKVLRHPEPPLHRYVTQPLVQTQHRCVVFHYDQLHSMPDSRVWATRRLSSRISRPTTW